ncbi:hypothetical protein M3Y97_01051200 [Aphelenchoides bicaudatus]|nr:hypothetical protein M3Y97_01051200 [Aphelenchoides bicaudatus]
MPNFTANIAKQVKPLEDMAFGIRHCDYFLLTSSGSTFGWWIAYLLPDNKQRNVFYRSLFFKKEHLYWFNTFTENDFVPIQWNRLVHDVEHDNIFIQDRSVPGVLI